MKKLIRISSVVILVLAVMVIGALIFIKQISHKGIPDYNQNIKIEGISHPVEVYRDSFAVPHVYAKNEKDLYTAVGYLMAQDRLWQMDLLRRATTGRLAEIFGKSLVDTDVLMRGLRIQEKSKLVLKNSSPEVIKIFKAFSHGVNQYIKENKDNLPLEFSVLQYKPEPWEPIHSINLIGYMAWDLTMPWSYEMALYKFKEKLNKEKYESLIPDLSNQQKFVYPEFEMDSVVQPMIEKLYENKQDLANLGLKVFSGSNNWAVSGEKSTTGKPILANDMHLGLFTPGIWYQMHQVVEGKLDVTGVVLPGQPFVISGHNDTIAWGMTNVMLDDMDFYRETLNKDTSQYKLNGKWKELETVKEQIAIRGGDTITKTLRFTHRGPIISNFKDINNTAISMKWIGNEYSNELRTVHKLNRASNWSEFKDAVSTFISISQNIVYADIHGNIGLYCCAGIPIREGNGIEIYPGDTTKYDWKGLVPFDQLPHSFNPESGILSSANNRTVDEEYPYYISHWFAKPYRIKRIRELLQSKEKLSVKDFKNIQTDQQSEMAQIITPHFINVLTEKEKKLNTTEKKALDKLKKWDYSYSKNSSQALIFEKFYINLAKNIAKDELGDSLTDLLMSKRILVINLVDQALKGESEWTDNVKTSEKKEKIEDLITESYKETIKQLTREAGKSINKWKWGEFHTLTLKHPISQKRILDRFFNLNKGPFAVGGSYHTVCPYSYSYNNPFKANHGASHRHIYNLGDWNKSWTVIPTGTSGIPASEHYCDQTEMYINKDYHPDYTEESIIKQNARYQMKFTKK